MAAPGSERASWRWLCERSALGELALYRVSDALKTGDALRMTRYSKEKRGDCPGAGARRLGLRAPLRGVLRRGHVTRGARPIDAEGKKKGEILIPLSFKTGASHLAQQNSDVFFLCIYLRRVVDAESTRLDWPLPRHAGAKANQRRLAICPPQHRPDIVGALCLDFLERKAHEGRADLSPVGLASPPQRRTLKSGATSYSSKANLRRTQTTRAGIG